MLDGALRLSSREVDDLPEAWNAKYKEYLGIVPPTDALASEAFLAVADLDGERRTARIFLAAPLIFILWSATAAGLLFW